MSTQTDRNLARHHQWSVADIADVLEAGFLSAEAGLRREQAVRGLDARSEVELHPLLQEIFEAASIGATREVRYPAESRRRRQTEGRRCDLVLTPDGKPLVEPQQKQTLFAPTNAVELEDAFWLEVKCVTQFTPEGPNSSYTSELLSTVQKDVFKLASDRSILHAGLLIMLFVASEEVAEHDLQIWQDKCLEQSLPIAAPAHRIVPITDRLGNRVCCLSLFPVRHL